MGVKRAVLAAGIMAILLALVAGWIAWFAPALREEEPLESIMATAQVVPGGNVIGDVVTLTIDVRYERNIVVSRQNIFVSPAPFKVRQDGITIEETIEETQGRLVMRMPLQCTTCVPGRSYRLSVIRIFWSRNQIPGLQELTVRVGPIFVSELIDPRIDNFKPVIRRPREPLLADTVVFFVALVAGGAVIAFGSAYALVRIWHPRRKFTRGDVLIKEVPRDARAREELLRIMQALMRVSENGRRNALARCAGILEETLEVLRKDADAAAVSAAETLCSELQRAAFGPSSLNASDARELCRRTASAVTALAESGGERHG